MNTRDIKLPPLPVPRTKTDGGIELFAEYSVREYARAAIKPYQQRIEELEAQLEAIGAGGVSGQPITSQRGGEPVAFAKDGNLFWRGDPVAWREFSGGLYLAPQPAEPVKAPGDGVRCNWCGWSGIEDDLVIETAADEPEEGPANVCPDCKRIGCLMDLGCDERAAQGLPPYSPRHLTEEEWNRLTESGRRAWGKKPDEPEKEPPCET